MNLYIRERETGSVVKAVAVRDEVEAEQVFRDLSSRIGSGLNVNPLDEYNWRDHSIDVGEVWIEPRHIIED